MSSDSKKTKFAYWDFRGLGEPIRLLLNYLEVDFEDVRVPLGDIGPSMAEPWTSQKYSHGLDLPNLPYYIDENVKLTQSLAILQHIGRKYDLYGDTIEEKAIIDMITQTVNDLRWQAWIVFNSKDFNEIKEDWKKTIPDRLGEMSKFLEGKNFVLGKKISFVDFLLYESMEWYREFAPELFEQSEQLANLNNFQKRIIALPQIKAYMESDRYKDWPLFSPIVYFGVSKDPDFKPMNYSCRNFFARYILDPIS